MIYLLHDFEYKECIDYIYADSIEEALKILKNEYDVKLKSKYWSGRVECHLLIDSSGDECYELRQLYENRVNSDLTIATILGFLINVCEVKRLGISNNDASWNGILVNFDICEYSVNSKNMKILQGMTKKKLHQQNSSYSGYVEIVMEL